MNELTYNARCTSRDVDRVEIGHTGIVINACQVKRPCGVIEVEPDGAVSVEPE